MQAQASGNSAPQFVVEVVDPLSPHPRTEDFTFSSVEELAAELDEHLHWGQGVCFEIAQRVAAGEEFEDGADDLEVTARLAGRRS